MTNFQAVRRLGKKVHSWKYRVRQSRPGLRRRGEYPGIVAAPITSNTLCDKELTTIAPDETSLAHHLRSIDNVDACRNLRGNRSP